MNREELRLKRKKSALIPTDENGNLKLENKWKISGSKKRAEGRKGVFNKKNATGTYTQFSFGDEIENLDEKVED